ncbi:MAG: MATE family efflux transporter [Lawsonibacter sp.]|nr:MATE family efflux transporter [Lawsonibacter sp.]MCI9656688.1 MATE family efflux transporter [Lawsonibacter sp.]
MAQPANENKMGIMPENKLLLNMALPMILSMLIQACYNIVDSYFVAKLSEDALNAVSLAFPVQNLMIAVSVGTGVGINALLSRSLGQKDQERANRTAMNGVMLEVVSGLVFTVLGLTCARLFYTVQTDIPGIVEYGADYLTIIAGCSMGIFLSVACERLVQATGRTVYAMVIQGTGSVINLILDPILIFGLFGFPRLEVAGAAVATVTGQIIGGLVGLYLSLTHNPELQMSVAGLRPSREIIKGIYSVGLPSIIMQSIGSVMVFGMNQILIAFTATATAVFGIYFKLQSFIFMPVFGLNNGMVPIVAYNYGAQKPERITRTVKLAMAYAVGIMAVGFALFQLFPDVFLSLFEAEGEDAGDLLTIGVPALRIISISFLMAGFCIVSSSVFQALGHGGLSLAVSAIRQLVVLLPAAFLLAQTGSLDAVWWSFPFADLFATASSILFLRWVYKKEVAPMRETK